MAYDSIKQFADRVKEIQAGTYQSSGGQKNTKTSYQQNLSVPAQTVSNNNYTTSRDVYSRIWELVRLIRNGLRKLS